jgi:hypothetical protein
VSGRAAGSGGRRSYAWRSSAEREHGVLHPHAPARRAAKAARVDRSAHAAVGRRMIAVASATLLAESRAGRRSAALPWALLVAGSIASLAADVAVAEPFPDRARDRGLAVLRPYYVVGAADPSDSHQRLDRR